MSLAICRVSLQVHRNCCILCFSYFAKRIKTAEAHRLLEETYGEHAPVIRTGETWFLSFKSGDFDLTDNAPCLVGPLWSGSLQVIKTDELVNIDRYRQQIINLNNYQFEDISKIHDTLQHCNVPSYTAKLVKDTLN